MSERDLSDDSSYIDAVEEEDHDSSPTISRQDVHNSLHENSSEGIADDEIERSQVSRKANVVKHNAGPGVTPGSLKKTIRKHKEAYREFFNSTIAEATGQYIQLSERGYEQPSQIGASTWTSFEKEIFYAKLSTLGRDNIKGLAAAVGTKSEIEVHQYIQLLSEGVVEGSLTQSLDVNLDTNIPAASEISRDCEAVLEVAADILAKDQLDWEKKREAKQCGDYWLLNDAVAEEIEEIFAGNNGKASNSSTAKHEQVPPPDVKHETDHLVLPVPAAELLNLENWLALSRHFMWQNEGSDNWASLAGSGDETPSMYNTAFQDFHNLTVSLTRRLLQATIFQVQSRMRARDRDMPSASIYAADVRAAARITGLEPSPQKFWATMPRRHGIKVYVREERPKHTDDTPLKEYHYGNLYHMPYDEVETKLGMTGTAHDPFDEEALDTVEDESALISVYDDPDMWTDVSYSASESEIDQDSDRDPEDPTFRPTKSHHKRDRRMTKSDFEKEANTQTERFDHQASALEEARLWSLFEISPPTRIKDEDTRPSITLHAPRRPKRSEHKDWRHAVDFRAEWEREMGRVPTEGFLAMQRKGEMGRKRRKLDHEQGRQLSKRLTVPRQDLGGAFETSDEEEEDEFNEPPHAPSPVQYYPVVWLGGGQETLRAGIEGEHNSVASTGSVRAESTEEGPSFQTAEEVLEEMRSEGQLHMDPRARSRSQDSRPRSMIRTPSRSARRPSSAQSHISRQSGPSTQQKASSLTTIETDGSLLREADTRSAAARLGSFVEDVEMEDAGDIHSDSSSEIDISRRTTPAPSRTQGSDTESNGEESGFEADIRRNQRSRRRKAKKEREQQELRSENDQDQQAEDDQMRHEEEEIARQQVQQEEEAVTQGVEKENLHQPQKHENKRQKAIKTRTSARKKGF